MQEIILLDEVKCGMKNKHTIMATGEKRFRQICMKDKTSYTITHTVKYGRGEENDWEAFKKLDNILIGKDINYFINNKK